MTEENILPMDGGDVPDDPQLRDRLVASYRNTSVPDDRMMSRCIRAVLDRAQAAEKPEPGFARRHWMIGAAAVAAALIVSVTVRSRPPIGEATVSPNAGSSESANTGASTPVASATAVAGGVQFDLKLPSNIATNVSIVGDFNGWDAAATPMVKDKSGEWSAKVTLLPGRHVYAYLVNGEQWVVDPLAPQIPDAGYGPANAVVVEGDTK